MQGTGRVFKGWEGLRGIGEGLGVSWEGFWVSQRAQRASEAAGRVLGAGWGNRYVHNENEENGENSRVMVLWVIVPLRVRFPEAVLGNKSIVHSHSNGS